MYFEKPEISFEPVDLGEIVTATSTTGGGEVDFCTTGDVVKVEGDDLPCDGSDIFD